MKTELLTVSKVFNEALFRIPDYQRGYSWTEHQLQDFWADLEQIDEDKKHYTGVLTLEAVPKEVWSSWDDDRWIITSRSYVPYYVVDGQQRLTTISIAIQCIYEEAEKRGLKNLNYTPILDVKRKYIHESREDSLAKSYIFGYERDNPSYEYLKTKIFLEPSTKHHASEETIYTRNLIKSKDFFREKIEGKTNQEIEDIYKKITQNFVFNAYEISEDVDVFVAFETMNNRGKPLSILELLKNRLIYLSMQSSCNSPEDRLAIRKLINESWKTAYHYLGKNHERPLNDDEFLRTHTIIFYIKNIIKNQQEDPIDYDQESFKLRRVVERPGSFLLDALFARKRNGYNYINLPEVGLSFLKDYSAHLKDCVERYFKLSSPRMADFKADEAETIERLTRLLGHSPNFIILSAYSIEKDHKKRVLLFNTYERYLFISSLRQSRVSSDANTFSEIVKYISGRTQIEDLITLYNNITNELISDDGLAESISQWSQEGKSYYGWRYINYLLYEYEMHLKQQSKTEREKVTWDYLADEHFNSEFISIEHIYPQKAKDVYWTSRFNTYKTGERRALRNSLGNLLALSRAKNSSLSNKPFNLKVDKGVGTVGYRYGGYSENEVSKCNEWTAKEIVDRGVKILDFMEQRWNMKIGNREQKIKALGLAFLDPLI